MDSLAGRTALVTGAAHGIGRATGELLERLGARVVALDHDEEALRAAFGEERSVCADVAAAATGDLAAKIWQTHGPVELLVNNVGIVSEAGFLDLEEDDFDRVFSTNLRGPWFLTKEIVRRLVREERRGSIVFVSSLHDTRVFGFPHYSASKAGVAMLVKELAHELGPHGIRVNAVSPGIISTAQNPASGPAVEDYVREVVPMQRVGQPADVAKVVAALLSEEWGAYVTGANVPVDGGLALHTWIRDPAPASEDTDGLLGRARRALSRGPRTASS